MKNFVEILTLMNTQIALAVSIAKKEALQVQLHAASHLSIHCRDMHQRLFDAQYTTRSQMKNETELRNMRDQFEKNRVAIEQLIKQRETSTDEDPSDGGGMFSGGGTDPGGGMFSR